jgi:hypothetical protein
MRLLTGTLLCWRCICEAGSGRLAVVKPCLCVGLSGATGRLGPGVTCSSCLFGAATAAAPLTAGTGCCVWVLRTATWLVACACACAHGAGFVCCCSILRKPGVVRWAASTFNSAKHPELFNPAMLGAPCCGFRSCLACMRSPAIATATD